MTDEMERQREEREQYEREREREAENWYQSMGAEIDDLKSQLRESEAGRALLVKVAQRIFDGLEQNIATVPKSYPHDQLREALAATPRAVELASWIEPCINALSDEIQGHPSGDQCDCWKHEALGKLEAAWLGKDQKDGK